MERRNHYSAKNSAQSFVFLTICLFSLFLICALGIDTGLLYLSKSRLERALDAATLAAVANFETAGNPTPEQNREAVALIMRNTAAANYVDLNACYNQCNASAGTVSVTQPNGQPATQYEYDFYMSPSNAAYGEGYLKVFLECGSSGQIVQAQCTADAPTHTYFIGFGGPQFRNLGVAYSSQANRSPRLVMICADRSASMLGNSGAGSLPNAIYSFIDYFDPQNDSIGLVSFGSNGRLEFPLTTNFRYAATNSLAGSTVACGSYLQSEDDSDQDDLPVYFTNGVRRLKFGGCTAADESLRIAMEQLMSNSGFANPGVQKIVVMFTDGAWNTVRTEVAAPGFTNIVTCPLSYGTNHYTNATYFMPTLTPYVSYTNLMLPAYDSNSCLSASCADLYGNDTMLSVDTNTPPELPPDGASYGATISSPIEGVPPPPIIVTSNVTNTATPVYSTNLNVWLPIGSVDYNYSNGLLINTNVSRLSSETNAANGELSLPLYPGGSNVLIVPGYLVDGMVCNNEDAYRFIVQSMGGVVNGYQGANYNDQGGFWPDTASYTLGGNYTHVSVMRSLVFRNFMNLMTGFMPMDAYDPPQTGPGATDPNIYVSDTSNNFVKPLHPFGEFYPGAAAFFCFNDCEMGNNGYESPNFPGGNLTTMSPSGSLVSGENWTTQPGNADFYYRSIMYTAAPQQYVTNNWNGQLFYFGNGDTIYSSGATSASTLHSDQGIWQQRSSSAQGWITSDFVSDMTLTTSQYTSSSNAALMNASVYRPFTYRGIAATSTNNLDPLNYTGGYMVDDTVATPKLYNNSMAYSSRPTHYYDFSQSEWEPISAQHYLAGDSAEDNPSLLASNLATSEIDAGTAQFTHLCFWKSMEYAYHMRALGVSIYAVGYSSAVKTAQCDVLGQMANAATYQNNLGTTITNPAYDPTQPVGFFYYATTPAAIQTDFAQIAQSVTGFLSP